MMEKMDHSKQGRAWNRSKLMLVGEGRAGKTSTLRCLLGQQFDPAERSTIGCTAEACRVERGEVRGWKEHEAQHQEYDMAVAAMAMEALEKGQGTGEEGHDAGGEGHAHSHPTGNAPASDPGPAVSRLSDDLVIQAMDDRKKDSIVLTTWDYGGQQVFYAVHHLFLTPYGVYLVVFCMSKLTNPKTRDSTLEFLAFWLNSIELHARGAAVLLVGTHRDQVPQAEKHQEISKMLLTTLGSTPAMDHVVRNESNGLAFFPLDNSRTVAEHGANELSAAVEAAVRGSAFVKQIVPLNKLAFFDRLQALTSHKAVTEGTARQHISFIEAVDIARQCGFGGEEVEAEVREALLYFHDLGQVIYYADATLSHLVILDPQFLIDLIAVIIRDFDSDLHRLPVDAEARLFRDDWTRLRREGVLSSALLEVFWAQHTLRDRNTFAYLMEKFSLMVPFRQRPGTAALKRTASKNAKNALPSGSQYYLIPSLLQRMDPLPSPDAESALCYLVMSSPSQHQQYPARIADVRSGFLPEGVFSRLLSKTILWAQQTFGQIEPHANHAEVLTGDYRFEISYEMAAQRIRLEIFVQNAEAVLQRVRMLLDAVIAESFRELKYHVLVAVPGQRKREWVVELAHLRSVVAAHGALWLEKKALSLGLFEGWVERSGLLESYDVFISYRVSSDADFAMKLYDCFSAFTVGEEGRRLRVFLDKHRLEAGGRWDVDFVSALAKSAVVVPIVSEGALASMVDLIRHDHVDNVLLEWLLALELYDAQLVKKVVPIMLGSVVANADPAAAMTNLFQSNILTALPRHQSHATYAKLIEHLPVLGLPTSERFLHTSVADTVRNHLLKHQGILGWRALPEICEHHHSEGLCPGQYGLAGLPEYCAQEIAHRVKAVAARESTVPSGPLASPELDPSSPNPNLALDSQPLPSQSQSRALSLDARPARASAPSVLAAKVDQLHDFVRELEADDVVFLELRQLGVASTADLGLLRKREVQAIVRSMKPVPARKFQAAVAAARVKPGKYAARACTVS